MTNMKTNHQIIELFPIPTFLIEKNNLKIIDCNIKGLILTQLNSESIRNYKISDFIEKSFINVGECEDCRFRINEQTCYTGNLTVQSFDNENLIVSFWSNINNDDISETEKNKDITYFTKALIDLSTDSIFILQDGIIRYANPNLLQIFGYTLNELIGIKFSEFVNPKELEKVNSIFVKREKGENSPLKYETSARLKNGKFIDVEVLVVQINFEGIPAFQVALRDITKRKIAERKYRNIIDFAPIGVYQLSKNGDILLVNKEMAIILGYENVDDLISKNISEFYYNDEEQEKLTEKYGTIENSFVKNVEIKFRKKDGTAIWILMTARALEDGNGETISYDGFVMDTSTMKSNELQLKQRVQIEELFNEISYQFVRGTYLETDKLINSALEKIGRFTEVDRAYVFLLENDSTLMSNTHEWCNDGIEPQINDLQQLSTNALPWWMDRMNKFLIIQFDNIEDLPDEAATEQSMLEKHGVISILVLPMISDGKLEGFVGFDSVASKKMWNGYDLKMLETMSDLLTAQLSRAKRIKDLNEAKNAAEEGEKKFKSLFYDNTSTMLLIDPNTGNIVDVNMSACKYYGYSYQQFKTLNISQINMLSEQEIKNEMQKAFVEERQYFNFKHKLASGKIRDVEVHSGKVNVSGNNLLYSIVHDNTERKQVEKEVLKLRKAIEQSPISIIITDLKGVIEYANPFTSELTSYESNELLGQNPRILSSGIHPKVFYKELWETILSGNVWQGEMCNKKKDGEFYWEHVIISPIKNNDGEITHFVGIKEDITEKREIHKRLRFLANSLEQVGECVSITNNEDILLYVNNAFATTYGYAKDELIGKHMSLFLPDDVSPSQIEKHFSDMKKGNGNGELINKRKDGSLFPILLSTSVVEDENNNQIAFIGVARDITELNKHTDELIASKEKAEESDRLKSAFLTNMSHEIRTPMNGILGFTSLLLEPDLSEETKDEFTKIIHKSGERLLNTVNDIIEISKIEAGLVEVKKSDLDVIEVLKNLDDFFKPQAKEKGLILSLENKSEETKLKINTDKSKFESILTNLIKNAIKYTDIGKIEVSYCVNNEFVQICVKDTGIGVPQNRINAIFNRFEQADIADSRALQGSGLGLAIAKSYVEILGGKIWVESIEGEGSTFCFTVPNLFETMKPDLNIQDEKTENMEKILSKLKILIVEDDEVSADFLEIILKDFAKKVIQANSGEQSIELCKINPDIDVILMDIKIPGINGFEATKRIREFNKNVIIIAQTAYALSGDREKAIDAGCNDYISKPIIKDELIIKIKKAFNNV